MIRAKPFILLLLLNLDSSSSGLTNYLLGLKIGDNNKMVKAMAISKSSCLNIIVEQLNSNAVQKRLQQPIFVEKCLHLVYKIASDSQSSTSVLRFLRNEHDFFFKQLETFIPVLDSDIILDTTTDSFVAGLHHCAWLLKIITLELHITASTGQRSSSQKLLSLLFRTSTINDLDLRGQYHLQPKNVSQPIIKVIEILHRIKFSEVQLSPLDLNNTKFAEIQLGDFMKLDIRGTEIFDILGLYWAIGSHFNFLISTNPNMNINERQSMEDTAKMILDTAAKKNRVQTVLYARYCCAQAWISLVRIAVKDYFDLLSNEIREKRISELLVSLLQHVNQSTIAPSIGVISSHAVLALVARLKHDSDSASNSLQSSSFEQGGSYQNFIIQGIIDGIMTQGSSASMRGNYYSSLITFLNYIKPKLVHSTPRSNSDYFETASLIFKQSTRFWEIICRDAVEGEVVWRTVAFAMLSCLCSVMNWSFTNKKITGSHPFIEFLTKRNFLGYYIKTLKETDDIALQNIIQQISG